MKVFVLGSTGMLGRYVASHLMQNHNVVGITRDMLDAERNLPDTWDVLYKNGNSGDVVINCAGLIKQKMIADDSVRAIAINSIFPWVLSEVCNNIYGFRLIHISTDCCFSGKRGRYTEADTPDADDMYGITKAAGEPTNATVIRTSIIGEGNFKGSLLEWVKSNDGGGVNGFTNHLWNGVTCLQLAKGIEQIITNKSYWYGVRHYFSETVTKAQLVRDIADVYDLNVQVTDCEADVGVDRTLGTIYDNILAPTPPIITQLKEQRDFVSGK